MKLAFCLFKYFPFGGLQRDFRHIAQVCNARGHSIRVFTMSWEGGIPEGFQISRVTGHGITNHRRCWNFSKKVNEQLGKDPHDLVIGFNKMQGLDVYYAADPCYKARVMAEKSLLYRLGPRCRTYLAMEKAVFSPSSAAHILLISEKEKDNYIRYYHTQENRFQSLSPGISADRVLPGNPREVREKVRTELGVGRDELLLLMVGSGFRTKGLDRALQALAGLPETLRGRTRLFVIGKGKTQPFASIAKKLRVDRQVHFLGGRDDVPRFMASADLLLHPAYSENTGTVLIEAMASGLPVLATDVCGYAFHVEKAGGGLLIPSPFAQKALDRLLLHMLTSPERTTWAQNGLHYVKVNDFFRMPEKAADIIEALASKGT